MIDEPGAELSFRNLSGFDQNTIATKEKKDSHLSNRGWLIPFAR